MTRSIRIVLGAVAAVAAIAARMIVGTDDAVEGPRESLPEIETHENVRAAGTLSGGVLSVTLVAAEGTWFPEQRNGPSQVVHAFGEEGGPLNNPGPLLRVPAGTEIRASIRNALAGRPLTVHGLHDRPGATAAVAIAPGETAHVRFRLTTPGTYFYWATTRGAPALVDRWGPDGQLIGALIVDPPGAPPDDHVFVIGVSEDSGAIPPQRRLRSVVVNGRSWPHSALHDVRVGDTVRMRWVNASSRFHPMHLHGFYFRVDARGDLTADTLYAGPQRRQAVTEMMAPGSTMALAWVPEREGNWLLHCHAAEHMGPELRGRPHVAHDPGHARNHALEVMSGLVTGWRVAVRESPPASSPGTVPPRRIRLLVQSAPARYDSAPAFGYVTQRGSAAPAADSVVIPGEPLVLTRGEPVEITVVNRLDEPTSVHWHGMELESYFDGVSGFSGSGSRISPPVAARDSFIVRFTPPRAGTFIYHSHFEEARQLASGLYGALIVLEPGRSFDPGTDLPWVISQRPPVQENRLLFNGSPRPVVRLDRGRTYRIRLINIASSIPLTFAMREDSMPVRWRAVAKDGADLPPHQAIERPAVQLLGVGEAYDFEFTPLRAGTLQLTARGPFGPIRLSGEVHVR